MPNKKYAYETVYEAVKEELDSSKILPGKKLPTEKELQERFSVSRDTVRRALSLLENEELIERIPGQGTFVKENKIRYELARTDSFTEQMNRLGAVASSEFVSIDLSINGSSKIREQLNVAEDKLVYRVARIRKADDKIMAYEVAYIPYDLCPNLHEHLDEKASLYNIYENIYGIKMGYAHIDLEAQLADKEVQKYLQIKASDPTLKMDCFVVQENDEPLYYVDCWYRADRYKFSIFLPR